MQFKKVLAQDHIKKHLTYNVDHGRIPHAQLLVGPEGSGVLPLAIAYSQYILCNNSGGENLGGNDACNLKFQQLAHPDLHFVFPVATNSDVKSRPVSNHFMESWRTFVSEQPYGNLFDWYKHIGIEKKQGQIGVDEATEIVKSLSLKSYEGGHKIMIIWMAEKMNIAASNKLLKLLEEPPEKTIFILIAEDDEQIIQTIKSRCQVIHFPPIPEGEIKSALIERGIAENEAIKIAHRANGNYNKAIDLVNKDSEDIIFEKWFVEWVRTAFKAKGNKGAIQHLISWSEQIANQGREVQKQFLNFCLEVFRQAMLTNYASENLVFLELSSGNFNLKKFAPFVHEGNIADIFAALQDAIYHIERNGNAKIILTDLSIKLTRLLHKNKS